MDMLMDFQPAKASSKQNLDWDKDLYLSNKGKRGVWWVFFGKKSQDLKDSNGNRFKIDWN